MSTILGSQALRRLLVHFALHPEDEFHLRALQRQTGLGIRSLQTELARLVEMGLIRRTAGPKKVLYSTDLSNPAWPALRTLIRSFVDVPEVLRAALAPVDGIRAAFVFGSYARGTHVRESDVDVLVLGEDIRRDELTRNTLEASMLLDREVNPLVYSPRELADRSDLGGSGFLEDVLAGPKRWIIGDEHLLKAA